MVYKIFYQFYGFERDLRISRPLLFCYSWVAYSFKKRGGVGRISKTSLNWGLDKRRGRSQRNESLDYDRTVSGRAYERAVLGKHV